jgi:hypothetical protein
MGAEQGIRQIAGDDVVEVGVLRDFILQALRHEVIADVSRQTVRKVDNELVEEGKLEVVPGERTRGGRPREYAYVEPAA